MIVSLEQSAEQKGGFIPGGGEVHGLGDTALWEQGGGWYRNREEGGGGGGPLVGRRGDTCELRVRAAWLLAPPPPLQR